MDHTTIFDHIEQLKAKPEHVRHRVAFGVATGFTAVVAVIWVAVLVFSGSLALSTGSASGTLSSANGQQNNAPQSPFQQLMGGVNAAFTGATTSPASLTSVDDGSSASGQQNSATNNGYSDTSGYTEPATTTTDGSGGDQTTISF